MMLVLDLSSERKLVDNEISKVLTQYRESKNLLHLIRNYGKQQELCYDSTLCLPDYFNIETSVGDQLTIIGKWLGFPRCHSVCEMKPTFGFNCEGVVGLDKFSGFCDDNADWSSCQDGQVVNVCINDDELYRKCLKVRIYQYLNIYDIDSLSICCKLLLGEKSTVASSGKGKVVLTISNGIGQSGSSSLLKIFARLFPISPGIEIEYSYVYENIFGFGKGYRGFCESDEEYMIGIQDASGAILKDDGGNLKKDDGNNIITDSSDNEAVLGDQSGDVIGSVLNKISGDWLCSFPANPYGC